MAIIERKKLSQYFEQAEPLIPLINTFSLFDVMTGTYYDGVRGEKILSGGLTPFTGFVGEGNTFKSTLMNDLNLLGWSHHPEASEMGLYDTENLAQRNRYATLALKYPTLSEFDLNDPNVFSITRADNMKGNKWFEAFKVMMEEKRTDKKALLTTPFANPIKGQEGHFKWYYPSFNIMDSISAYSVEAVEKILEKGETGDSERNMLFTKDGLAKTQLMMEFKDTLSRSGQYFSTVAHVGDTVNIDGKPERKKLTYMRQGQKMKGVPAKFDFYTGVCYEIFSVSPLMAADKNGPQYPRSKEDDLRGDTDLSEISVRALRNKFGPSGIPFKVVVSQSEGLQVSLTEYHYCKEYDYFGIGGNKTTFFMDLYPECSLMRTTIRRKIDEDARLRRALQITAELCMMTNIWHKKDFEEVKCTPKELYEDIKALGYDWNELLDTRGYWTYEEEKHPVPYLSTLDLLRMRKGLYKPYWMKDKK